MTKTGSTAIETELAPLCDIVLTGDPRVKHMQLRRFERFIRPYLKTLDLEDIETTCLFREPLDWLGSWYRYRQRPALEGKPNSTSKLTFDAFVEEYLKEEPKPFARVGQQSQFVLTKDRKPGIDHLFRYEDFGRFTKFISDRFDCDFEFARRNVSPQATLALSARLRRAAKEALSNDYEIYEAISR